MSTNELGGAFYSALYREHANYRMGPQRLGLLRRFLPDLLDPDGGANSLLDVGCGRAESLDIAAGYGFSPVRGLEVAEHCAAMDDRVEVIGEDSLGQHRADVVLCLDVMEHLQPARTEGMLAELVAAANRYLLLSIHTGPSREWNGHDLHINRRRAAEWLELVGDAAGDRPVKTLLDAPPILWLTVGR